VNGIPQADTYLHTDALGSVVAESSASGSIVKRNDYAPWGEPISGPLDGLGYTGHEMDADTGLVYAQQRYYDPIVGRFLSVDPVTADAGSGGNFNRYWYANNNPYRFTDPDGRFVPVLLVGVALLFNSEDANAPGPGDTVEVKTGPEALMEVAEKLPALKGLKAARTLGRVIEKGKNFTKAQKREILKANRERNGGVLKSDKSGKELVPAKKSEKGVTPPENEVQVDHRVPKSKGGSNDSSNADVLSRKENRDKSDN